MFTRERAFDYKVSQSQGGQTVVCPGGRGGTELMTKQSLGGGNAEIFS